GGRIYSGTADATPLFVMLLGELRRWGLAREAVDGLLPAADRALEGIRDHGDADVDGYVEYQRLTDRGLVNQGWKDSWDAIRFVDGRLARPPIALCEVQGYVYGAYLARAHFADERAEPDIAADYRAAAAALKAAFNRDFWIEDRGWFALGLDGDKQPIDALASNMGHCLWTAMLDAAAAQGNRLPELFSGLSRADVPFPVSYPSSCSPQAWAAASPLLFLRTLLRLEPWLPHGKVWLDPVLPERIGFLRVDRIPL